MNRTRGKIRPPRRGLATDPVDFDEYWDTLAQSLREIHAKNASRLSFEELYRNAYKLVLKKHGEKLYANVKQLVVEHLKVVAVRDVRPLVPSAIVTGGAAFGTASSVEKRIGGDKFLDRLKVVWEDHQLCMGMMKDVLMYMDRVFCADHKIPSIYVTCMGLFRDHILRNPQYNIGKALNTVILDQIKMEREGDIINHATIRSCVYMLEALYENEDENENEKIYLTSFEGEFLAASGEFYKQEGVRLLRECDAATYLRKTDKRLSEEYSRSHDTLSTLSEPKIRAVVERELITNNIKEVMDMDTGLRFMLDNDRFEDLKLVYKLVARVDPEKQALKTMLCKRLVELGREINKNANPTTAVAAAPAAVPAENGDSAKNSGAAAANEDKAANNLTVIAIRWVDEVIALKDKYEKVWTKSFDEDKGVQASMTGAFREFINLFQRSPEYMSLFIDDNLRKGLKGKSEAEVDAVLDKAITLFRYINDKDVFERYYKKHLSRRLLMNRSVSQDAEKQMIGKLKMEVGVAFTNKLEGMFKDMNISDEMTSEFKKMLQNKEGSDEGKKIDLTVNVLTSTFWPMTSMGADGMQTCSFPKELEALKDSFTTYYLGRHSGRKLSWQANMGNADLKTSFKGVKKELNVSTYAMVVLLAFNNIPAGESISFEDLTTITSIPQAELIRTLQSLAAVPKTRILRKNPATKDVRPTDTFAINESFTSKFTRIKVGMVSANRAETEKERKDTSEKVDETRAHQIEAAVVRIMKQRKVLSHAELVSEVISQLKGRFNPDVAMIKKRVESLMEREYLARIDGERHTYKYLA